MGGGGAFIIDITVVHIIIIIMYMFLNFPDFIFSVLQFIA